MLFGPQGGDSASVQEDGALPLGDDPRFDHVHKPVEHLAGVAGVQEDGFGAGQQL